MMMTMMIATNGEKVNIVRYEENESQVQYIPAWHFETKIHMPLIFTAQYPSCCNS